MLFASSDFGESFILEIVAIVLIAWVVRRYVYRRPYAFLGNLSLKQTFAGKIDSIRAQLAAGDEARAAAEQLLVLRRSELDAADGEAKMIVEQSQRTAEQLITDAKRRSEEEYERLVAHAGAQIALERVRMHEEISASMSALVIEGAHRLVDAELNASRHRRLVEESIVAVESEARA